MGIEGIISVVEVARGVFGEGGGLMVESSNFGI